MGYGSIWAAILAADTVSESIDRQTAENKKIAEQKDIKSFLSNNYACIILSKEKEIKKKHLLGKTEYLYYFKCLGLNTNTTCRISFTEKIWNGYREKEIVRFENNKEQIKFDEFKVKNDEIRIVDKIDDSSTYMLKLYGLPSKDIYFVEVNKKDYDNYNIADYIKKNDESLDSNASDYNPTEDTWYNIPMSGYTTLEMEDAIAECPPKGYVYFYYGDHNFPEEINEVCEKIISIKDYNKIITRITKLLSAGATLKDNIFSKLVNDNEELFECYKKLQAYLSDNPLDKEKGNLLDNFHIASSDKKIYGYFIDDLISEDEVDLMALTIGIVRVKKEFFDRYPIQARQKFCNITNSVYGIGIWFKEGRK